MLEAPTGALIPRHANGRPSAPEVFSTEREREREREGERERERRRRRSRNRERRGRDWERAGGTL
jgi:hypothetical protein